MRRDSRRFVRDLGLPPASNIRELLPAVGERSGYSIRLVPAPGDSSHGVCGMWIRAAEGVDYIFVHESTSRVHQDHIIAHEVAHILRDHRGSSEFRQANPMTDRLVSTLDPAVVTMMLGRSGYEYEDEREAELIGSYLQRLIHGSGWHTGDHDRMAATLLRRR